MKTISFVMRHFNDILIIKCKKVQSQIDNIDEAPNTTLK